MWVERGWGLVHEVTGGQTEQEMLNLICEIGGSHWVRECAQ